MHFGREKKYALQVMRSRKWKITQGIELTNQENQNTRRKGNLQVLGNIRSRHHQTNEVERKNLKRESQENAKTTLNQTI